MIDLQLDIEVIVNNRLNCYSTKKYFVGLRRAWDNNLRLVYQTETELEVPAGCTYWYLSSI